MDSGNIIISNYDPEVILPVEPDPVAGMITTNHVEPDESPNFQDVRQGTKGTCSIGGKKKEETTK